MLRNKFITCASLCVMALISSNSFAARGGSSSAETPPPKIYTERAKALLKKLSAESALDEESALTPKQKEEFKEILKKEDEFIYDQPKSLIVKNEVVNYSLNSRDVIEVKLGHTYNTTVVFTDVLGNPWQAKTLASMSDNDVVSLLEQDGEKATHIFTFKPKKLSGQTNLPIKLLGEQYPITLLFTINDDEVYFNLDVKVEGLGNSLESQRKKAMDSYADGNAPSPLLNKEPETELMLQNITPEGYAKHDLRDSYGDRVDSRDFTAWSHDNKLYIMTPHQHYSPQPIDVSVASDGRHKLFEYNKTSVVLVRRNSQVLMLYIK